MKLEIDNKTALALTNALIVHQTKQKERVLSAVELEEVRLIDENVLRVILREANLQSASTPQEYLGELFS